MRVTEWLARWRDRLLAPTGWWATSALSLLAFALRFPNLGRPHEFSFDETYYAKDAYSYLKFGYERAFVDDANTRLLAGNTDVFKTTAEFVVHPPVGKWAIALGEAAFGVNPFGWRIVMVVLGVAAVALTHRTMLRLSGNVYTAGLAGLFFAIDGLAIVMSRTALLDQTLMFFVLVTFFALVRDRDYYAHTLTLREYLPRVPANRIVRPWRLLAIVTITLAFGTKWSALWFALGFALLALWWDLRTRHDFGISASRTWLADLVWLGIASIAGITGYLATWVGWFRSTGAWDRTWTDGPQLLPQALRALLYYHQQALQFHTHLTSSHPYKAAPYWWPLMVRPTSFSYNTYSLGQQGCPTDSCSAEVLALGNIAIWWVASLVIVVLALHGLAKLLRLRISVRGHVWAPADQSRIRWDVTGPLLIGIAAGWLPWIYWHARTTFTFYSIVYAPFMFMLAAYGLQVFATRQVVTHIPTDPGVSQTALDAYLQANLEEYVAVPPTAITITTEELHEKRFLVAVLIVAFAVGVTVFFLPIWTGAVIPYSAWHARMWLPSWI